MKRSRKITLILVTGITALGVWWQSMPPVFVEVGELGLYHHAGPEIVVRPNGKFVYLLRHLENRFDVIQHWRDLHKIDTDSHDMTKGYLPALRKAHEMSSADD